MELAMAAFSLVFLIVILLALVSSYGVEPEEVDREPPEWLRELVRERLERKRFGDRL